MLVEFKAIWIDEDEPVTGEPVEFEGNVAFFTEFVTAFNESTIPGYTTVHVKEAGSFNCKVSYQKFKELLEKQGLLTYEAKIRAN